MTIAQLLSQHTNNLPESYSTKQSKNYIEIFDQWGNNILYAHVDGRQYTKQYRLINGIHKEIVVHGYKTDKKTGNLTPFRRESFYTETGNIKYETSTDGVINNNNTYRKIIGQELEKVEPRKIQNINKSTKLF